MNEVNQAFASSTPPSVAIIPVGGIDIDRFVDEPSPFSLGEGLMTSRVSST